jgi:hypothetical protein
MSKLEVDTIVPQSGSQIILGESGDTVTIPAGATFDASSGTLTLADGSVTNAKLANSSITINGTAISLGASGEIVAGLDWQAVKTSSFTAVSNEGYAVNTTSGTVAVTLPASPSLGDNVGIVDYAGTFNSNNCTLNPNGGKIEGSTSNQVLQTSRVAINLTYIDATQGWLVTSEGSSTPITIPEVTWDTASGTLGTITDAQRSGGYTLASAGGSANIGSPTFTITGGALPGGLSMSSSGAFSGTVSSAVASDTTFNITVTATIASFGYTETRAFSLIVNAPIIAFNTNTGSIGTVQDNQRSNGSYSLSAVTATTTSGTLAYSVTTGSLPASVSLNSSTGAITGNFNVVASNTTTTFTISATEGTITATREFSITVVAPTISFNTASGSIGTVQNSQRSNGNYSLSAVTATTTSGTLTYSVSAGSLPGSVSLNTSSGAITGDFDSVGSDTTTTFTISATEGTVTATREFSITVIAPVNVSYLVVAGGAGGGSGGFFGAGGGGAGGLLTGTISGASGSYSISIGGAGGGAGGTSRGGNGGTSSISGVASATGGGGGAAVSTGAGSTNRNGASGGSGGGGGHDGGSGSGGSGTSGQGNSGGNGSQGGGGGGGGGKGSSGGNAGGSGGIGGSGGNYSTVASATSSGDSGYYASGGSGGNNGSSNSGGGGGSGSSGQTNTGGGGGKQASGGSGIVILYYTSGSQQASGGTVSNSGGVYYHKFTSGGTFTVN